MCHGLRLGEYEREKWVGVPCGWCAVVVPWVVLWVVPWVCGGFVWVCGGLGDENKINK